jgi:hypothetical protein
MGLVAAIRQAFARREDPYAGGDLALARKLDGSSPRPAPPWR